MITIEEEDLVIPTVTKELIEYLEHVFPDESVPMPVLNAGAAATIQFAWKNHGCGQVTSHLKSLYENQITNNQGG